jgi:hypothetical protein
VFFLIVKNKAKYCRYWGRMWGFKGFIGIHGYKKEYLVKIGVSFIQKDVLGGGFNKSILEGIYQYLVKLGVFFNIP